MEDQKQKIGLIGLAVMGENLALNIEEKGFPIAVYNRTVEKVADFVQKNAGKKIKGTTSPKDLVASLERPRRIIMMVKAGKPVDDTIAAIKPFLEKDDMLAIAEYFSKKPWPDLGQPRSPKDVAGRALSAQHSVGCTGCHLDKFQGDGTVPRLAGQSREYLTKTIADFRTRARGNNPGMSDLMLATPPDDLAALAEYLAGL